MEEVFDERRILLGEDAFDGWRIELMEEEGVERKKVLRR